MNGERAARIDAHMHWWTIRRTDYGWLRPELTVLYHDFGPAEAEPLLYAAGIDGVILVQAAQAEAETHYLLGLAASRAYVRGVVGWAPMEEVSRLEALVDNPKIVAIRPMLQDLPDPDWILRRELTPALRLLEEWGVPFEALIYPEHLPRIATLIERHPRLRVMLDHAAKPRIEARLLQPWKRDLARLAACPNVACKLSGLVTEAEEGLALDVLVPYVEAVFELFGAQRIVWGSDWPVLTLRLDYATWLRWAVQFTTHLPPDARAGVFGANAERFYARRSVGEPGYGGSGTGSMRPSRHK